MNLHRRISKLERNQSFRACRGVMARFVTALDETALRLTGAKFEEIQREQEKCDMILDVVSETFFSDLNAADREELAAELEQIAFDGDTAALEQARADVLAGLV